MRPATNGACVCSPMDRVLVRMDASGPNERCGCTNVRRWVVCLCVLANGRCAYVHDGASTEEASRRLVCPSWFGSRRLNGQHLQSKQNKEILLAELKQTRKCKKQENKQQISRP